MCYDNLKLYDIIFFFLNIIKTNIIETHTFIHGREFGSLHWNQIIPTTFILQYYKNKNDIKHIISFRYYSK